MMPRKKKPAGRTLIYRLETNVDKDLADWVARHAEDEQRAPAAILRRALQAYRAAHEKVGGGMSAVQHAATSTVERLT